MWLQLCLLGLEREYRVFLAAMETAIKKDHDLALEGRGNRGRDRQINTQTGKCTYRYNLGAQVIILIHKAVACSFLFLISDGLNLKRHARLFSEMEWQSHLASWKIISLPHVLYMFRSAAIKGMRDGLLCNVDTVPQRPSSLNTSAEKPKSSATLNNLNLISPARSVRSASLPRGVSSAYRVHVHEVLSQDRARVSQCWRFSVCCRMFMDAVLALLLSVMTM